MVLPPVEVSEQEILESAGGIELRWDASLYPVAAIAHLVEGERTTLALSLRGGVAQLPAELPAGGIFEVSLSDGLGTRHFVISR